FLITRPHPISTLLSSAPAYFFYKTNINTGGRGSPPPPVVERASSWPQGALHLERFSAPPAVPVAGDVPFEVLAKRSGITVTVPADGSILKALDDAGVNTLSSCSEGICGACETLVVEGKPDHRDHVLTEEEKESGEYIMICVSRACTKRIVLDI
ncbi:2Fe-2S iron-sulfur cluster-binding protein, partial [Embleya sp. NPDC059213]|uniref:2Fe-2S iron-sulfur cluster-binding protein n=1 Tax=Embleya sp. NPDC059213 TaxID=3346771 RepID=UPI0036C87274